MTDHSSAKILVVDDVPEKLLAVEAILAEPGQAVVPVHSGAEALRRLLTDDFAVILLDVNMPEMDGFETAALIRQRRQSEHTPIIFLTAFPDDTFASRGYSLGAVRLHSHAGRARGAAREGIGVRRPLQHVAASQKAGRRRRGAGSGALGAPGGRAGQPRQERVPGQREPRAAHPDERHHRHDRPGIERTAAASRAGVPRLRQIERSSAVGIAESDPGFLQTRIGQVRTAERRVRAARAGGGSPPHLPLPRDGQAHRAANARRRRRTRSSDRRSPSIASGVDKSGVQRHQVY